MAIRKTIDEIVEIVRVGDYSKLLGVAESSEIEFKSSPYQLDNEIQRLELAKDVSALANADGGIIIIGAQTQSDPAVHGDVVRSVSSFRSSLIDSDRYRSIINSLVIPTDRGLELTWHPDPADNDRGMYCIFVPKEATLDFPYLVNGAVIGTSKISGAHIGFFERIEAEALPTSALQLRNMLREGFRNTELNDRLATIETALLRQLAPKPQSLISPAELHARISSARESIAYKEKPTFYLAAAPESETVISDLFESPSSETVRIIENPPRLRQGGFDLGGQRSSIIHAGQLRRAISRNHKVLDVWQDGAVIFVTGGDEWHLAWGMNSTVETGLRVNSLALAETIYVFCEMVFKIYLHMSPSPESIKFIVGFTGMSPFQKPFTLPPSRPNRFFPDDREAQAPAPELIRTYSAKMKSSDPTSVSYKLLRDIYAWFGFDASDIPYFTKTDGLKFDLGAG